MSAVQTDQLVTRETRHSKRGNGYQMTCDVDKSDAQSLTHINEVLYRCFHGLQWWSCTPPPLRRFITVFVAKHRKWMTLFPVRGVSCNPSALCNVLSNVFSFHTFWNMHWFRAAYTYILVPPLPPFQHFIVLDRRGWLGSKICFTVWGENDF